MNTICAVTLPIPMLIHCPMCGGRHIDKGEFATKAHHTHACQHRGCGHVWRPAVVDTVGVEFLPGFRDGDADQKPCPVVEWCEEYAGHDGPCTGMQCKKNEWCDVNDGHSDECSKTVMKFRT